MQRQEFGLKQFVFVLGVVLFFAGGLPFPLGPSASFDPWRVRLISLGLFWWALSTAL